MALGVNYYLLISYLRIEKKIDVNFDKNGSRDYLLRHIFRSRLDLETPRVGCRKTIDNSL